MRHPLLLALFLAVPCASVSAQIQHRGEPASATGALPAELPVVFLPRPDVARYQAEDAASTSLVYRYGAIVETAIGVDDAGRWDSTEEAIVWRVEIASPGAYSLGVLFDQFDLPAGGAVYLYDPARSTVLGSYTEESEQPNGQLAIQPVPGDRVVVEYVQQRPVTGSPKLRIGQVVHDYRDILDRLRGQQQRAICFIDVNCPEGAPYQDIKESVVEVLVGGGQCSAALLNNTDEDGIPYMLTANHCGNMTNVVAIFRYERTDCGSGSSSTNKTISGATLLAATSTYDSQLYRFNQTPPANYRPFYAGWSRGQSFVGPTIGIHHPQGNPKKISIDQQAPSVGSEFFSVHWEDGQVHGGSSGSPLFTSSQRVIGPACCVTSFDCGAQDTLYGRFGKFWNSESLGQWLDPGGISNGVWDGIYPFTSLALKYNGSGLNPDVLAANPPVLGTQWSTQVDTSAFPAATSVVFALYAGQSSGTFVSWGELLVDLSSPKLFSVVAPVNAGLAFFNANLPNDPALAHSIVFEQAAMLGGGVQLTNGVKLVVN